MSERLHNDAAVAHPAPNRNRASWLIVAVGLVLAPAAWFLQLNASFLLGAARCPGAPLGPPAAITHAATVAAGIAAAVLAVLALASAARVWSQTRTEAPGDHHAALTAGHGRTRFLGLAGIIISCIFLVAVGFSLFVPWMVRACGA
jgi:hypothetical protein